MFYWWGALIISSLMVLASSENRVLYKSIPKLEFDATQVTLSTRHASRPQMTQVGGDPTEISRIRCINVGWDGIRINWDCRLPSNAKVSLDEFEIMCEFLDTAYVLNDSCYIEFSVKPLVPHETSPAMARNPIPTCGGGACETPNTMKPFQTSYSSGLPWVWHATAIIVAVALAFGIRWGCRSFKRWKTRHVHYADALQQDVEGTQTESDRPTIKVVDFTDDDVVMMSSMNSTQLTPVSIFAQAAVNYNEGNKDKIK